MNAQRLREELPYVYDAFAESFRRIGATPEGREAIDEALHRTAAQDRESWASTLIAGEDLGNWCDRRLVAGFNAHGPERRGVKVERVDDPDDERR